VLFYARRCRSCRRSGMPITSVPGSNACAKTIARSSTRQARPRKRSIICSRFVIPRRKRPHRRSRREAAGVSPLTLPARSGGGSQRKRAESGFVTGFEQRETAFARPSRSHSQCVRNHPAMFQSPSTPNRTAMPSSSIPMSATSRSSSLLFPRPTPARPRPRRPRTPSSKQASAPKASCRT